MVVFFAGIGAFAVIIIAAIGVVTLIGLVDKGLKSDKNE